MRVGILMEHCIHLCFFSQIIIISFIQVFDAFFSLGMKDSLGPLKALLVASAVNGIGHVVLCNVLHYGIVGAAWATMASQVC